VVDPKGGRRPVIFIFITVLIDSVGFGLILPVLPQLIVELTGRNMGGAAAYGGWLAFSYALVQFFAAPVLGGLSDRFGRRPVLLASLFALGVDYLVMGVAPTIGWLFLGRVVAGMAGASFTTAYAYLADVSTPDRRAQNFGLVGAAFGMGFIIGPAIGGLIGTLGPRAPFFAAATLALLNTAFGLFALPESLPPCRAPDIRMVTRQSARHAAPTVEVSCGHLAARRRLLLAARPPGAAERLVVLHHLQVSLVDGGGRRLAGRRGHRHGARAGRADPLAHSAAGRRPSRGGPRHAFRRHHLPGICILDAGLDDVRLAARLASRRSRLSFVELADVTRDSAERPGGVAGRRREPLRLELHPRPSLMTGLFGYFTSDRTAYIFPGAPFVAAALLVIVSVLLLNRGLRPAAALDPRASTPLTTDSKESL
jgi:DHA1 family tetracycline resistance protein-like MFS transporter